MRVEQRQDCALPLVSAAPLVSIRYGPPCPCGDASCSAAQSAWSRGTCLRRAAVAAQTKRPLPAAASGAASG